MSNKVKVKNRRNL